MDFFRAAFLHAGNQDFLHIAADGFQHGGFVSKIVVLGGEDDAVDALGLVSLRILHGDLRFGVRTQVGHFLALLADGGEFLHEAVGQFDGQRHVVVHFVAGIAEHHALVARTLIFGSRTFNALVDVRRLAMDGGDDTARLEIKLVVALSVADALDSAARNIVNGNIAFSLHLAGADYKSGGYKCLACHFRLGILREDRVQ